VKNYLNRAEVKTQVQEWIGQIRDLVDKQEGLTIDVSLILLLADQIEDELFTVYGDKRAKMERVGKEEVVKKIRTGGMAHTAAGYDISRVGLQKWCERHDVDWKRLEAAAPYPESASRS
jgi:hypothetical protein